MNGKSTRYTALTILLLALPTAVQAYSPMPDLRTAGAIAALKADANSSPVYPESYNLGPTGLRGWIYIDRNNMGNDGLQTARSRQILVTVASTPGSSVLAVDDVILGVKAGSGADLSYPADAFTGDCRKAFGWAIGDAETTANAGVMRVLRWRAGTTSSVVLTLPVNVRGTYATSAPYGCEKSTQILANARNRLVGQLLASPNFLETNYGGAITGLALLGGVAPADPNFSAVQARLQAFARALAPADLVLTGCDTWNWGYIGVFLSEYYLRTVADGSPDNSVLHGINAYTVGLAKGQSKYGTFGHGGAEKHADGSLHGSISWYGPVNSAGIPANVAIVMGKKALQMAITAGAAGAPAVLDPEINPAIERGSNFFGWYVNKGAIPYGEHEPYGDGHASNGKDEMCAVLFGLQDNRPVEAEFFARMSVAGCTGREYGHTGQGFSYLWGAMGANMGGPTAVAEYLKTIRWHLDLERRTDGSFVYDGGEQYGGGTTADGTYLGASAYNDVNPTASYILTYALPLQRLYLTGKDLNAARILTPAKVANAIAASTFKQDCTDQTAYPVSRLIDALREYDPALRSNAASELARRTLTTAEVDSLLALAEGADANARMGACEALGALKVTRALPVLAGRLNKTLEPDPWVRGKASNALKNFGSAASGQLTPMLTAFAANATDPEVIVWDDPVQIANGYLADTLFQALASNTNALVGTARTSLLYPALRAGLKQPDGMARMYLGDFIKNRLSLADVQAVAPSLVAAAAERSPADRMFSDVIRYAALNTLGKYKVEEGIPLCLRVKEQTWHGDDWDPFTLLQNTYRGAAKDALPTLYKWRAHLPQFAADSSTNTGERLANISSRIASTIAAIENDAAPPALTYFKTLSAASAPTSLTLPATTTTLTAAVTDLDAGKTHFVWTKVSGAGNVTFTPGASTDNSTTCSATFDSPGSYQLRVMAVDRSILDSLTWITYSLGYYDFQTYNELLAPVTKDLTVTVGADPNRAPVAQNQSVPTPVNTAVAITLTASDPNGDAMTFAVVTQPTHGTLSGTTPQLYTPADGYTGPDSFTFLANDGKLDSVAATITIDVGAAGNRRPVALNQYLTTAEDTAKTLALTGIDADGNPLTYEIVTGPAHGTLSGTPPSLTYTPAANYPGGNATGADSFTFTVRDASLTSATATVSLTVTPVNDPPLAQAQNVSVSVNTANPVTLTGVDVEGYALSYTLATNPGHGTLSGTAPNLTYRPAANYHGADSFTFKVTDSEGVASATATVAITVINDPPVANPQVLELQPNIGNAVTLTGSDNCNDALTYSVVTQPVHGQLSGAAPNLTYTPTPNYSGPDSFTFKVNDGTYDSPVAAVSLNVVGWLTWTNVAPGTWSTGANWLGGVAPAAGGSTNGLLVFNTGPYAGTSTHNLTGTFSLGRLSFGSALPSMSLGGNPLAFNVNSSSQPQMIQNSAGAITVSNNLTIISGTTVSGSGSGSLTLAGIISGTGSLTKTCSGNLMLSGVNTYSGGTTVSSGAFTLGNKNGFGTGVVTLAGGVAFETSGFEGNGAGGAWPNPVVLSGGMVTVDVSFGAKDIWTNTEISGPGGIVVTGGGRSQGLTLQGNNTFQGGLTLGTPGSADGCNVQLFNVNSLGTGTLRSELMSTDYGSGGLRIQADLSAGVANPIYLVSDARLVVNTSPDGTARAVKFTGPVTGGGSLVKTGTGTLTLTGANTYSGATRVTAGSLACASAFALGGGTLEITSGASVQLNFTGTRRVAALTLGGTAQAATGTYGSTNSGATYQSSYFAGAGTVTVGAAFAVTTTALALTGGTAQSMAGNSLTFTASVANGNAPSGSVAFYAGTTLLGTVTLDPVTFQASFTTTNLASGSNTITARYAGDPANDPSVSTPLTIQVTNPADIQSFTVPGMLSATLSNTSVSVIVPYATAVTALAPSYTLSPGATCDKVSGGPTTYDFTSPVTYSVKSADLATTKAYSVTVTKAAASTAKDITSFVFPGLPTPTIGATTITLSVPFGTAVAALTPYYTVSAMAVPDALYPSGSMRNFTTPQTYTIKDPSGASKIYTVTVTVAAPSTACDILACSFTGLGTATISGNSVVLTVPPSQAVTALTPAFTLSPLASISPASGVAQNFTDPIVYRVTAQNGTTYKDYTVSVLSYLKWSYSASLYILTTPEGANIAAGATETNFPLLVRLNSSNFNFGQAQSDGRDIRFATVAGAILPYQIEQWDAAAGAASIWVKIPSIAGNARQEIRMYWGQSGVVSESSGANVFNAANGFACVMHMNESLTDELGAVLPTNVGTTVTSGMIGKARNFTAGNGVACGKAISTFAQGATAHSTEAWFRADSVNTELVDWGVEGGGYNKVQIRIVSPPRIYVDGNFASVTGTTTVTPSLWHHVVHTYASGVAKLYVDGALDASASVSMSMPNPSLMWIGGWYDSYNHVGDIDEVRVSKVARSANWIKLEYENQKPLQTLVGAPVQAGATFAVSPTSVTLNEGGASTLTGQAGGAQKVYWIERRNGVDTVIATDVFALSVAAGRVAGSQSYAIQFKAVYATEVKTVDVPITVSEYLPDPVFTLNAPAIWDGRQTLSVTSNLTNLADMQAKGVASLNYHWSATGVAATTQTSAGTLTLLRSQGSGRLTVTLTIDNGGTSVSQTKTIMVQEPASDAWAQRSPDIDEQPVDYQFIARDDTGYGRIHYNGTQTGSPSSVFLKIYTTDTGTDVPYGSTLRQTLVGTRYAFTAAIAAGKATYKVVYGTTTGSTDTIVRTVTDLICGDAYIIEGQSNAVADDPGAESPVFSNPWIRTYTTAAGWGNASQAANSYKIGYWGVDLAARLLANNNMPVCIINGAVGGTRIDQHQPNPADHYAAGSSYSIYANLLTAVADAKLTHGIRGVLWHQGEQDQGSGAPTGDYDYKTYQQYFVDMSAAWKQDFPNIQHYYIFQIWPNACGDVSRNDQLREVQRTLPCLFSNMRIMSSVGIVPGSSCHYVPDGYQKFADLMGPLVEQDNYGYAPASVFTAPDLKQAYYTTATHNEITLEFGQNMAPWVSATKGLFYLDGVAGKVSSGSVTGKVVKLQVAAATAQKITYLQGTSWDGVQGNLLYGTNGVAALTFAEVGIALPAPAGLTATSPDSSRMVLSWSSSSGATAYKVKRALTQGGPYTQLGTPTSGAFTDLTVSGGTTYYYVVSATNGADESANSAEVSAMASVNGTGVASLTVARHAGTGAATTYGDSVSFDVSLSGTGIPTGTVTLKDGGVAGAIIGSATLANGTCTLTSDLGALSVGSHNNIVAVYSGDVNFAAVTSSALPTQTVSQKALTVSNTTVAAKVYDGTTAATLSGATLSGVVGSDVVTLVNATSGTFNTKDVGAAKAVVTAMTLAGTAAGNYTLIQPLPSGVITAKALILSGTTTVTGKTYDGSTAATLAGSTLQSAEAVGTGSTGDGKPYTGDAVTLNLTGAFNTKNVGTGKVVTSTSSLTGSEAGNYSLTQPTGLTGTILARVVALSGNRSYDGTTSVAVAGLTVSNKVVGDDLTLNGNANLAGKGTGAQMIYVTPIRIGNAATGAVGTAAASSFTVTVAAPTSGNTLIAVISTRSSSASAVTGISNSGTALVWTRAAQSTPSTSTTTEIWYAPVVPGAGTDLTVNLNASLFAAAVVAEYSGVLTAVPVDRTASNSNGNNSTSATTGTTLATTLANELAIGGIGLRSSSYSLGTPLNSFASVNNAQSGSSTAGSNARVYFLEKVLTSKEITSSGGATSSSRWSGAIATFKAGVALAGAEIDNYTLTGASGSVLVTPKALSVTADNQGKTYGQTLTFGSGSSQFTSSGLQNGETIGSVTLACSGGSAAATPGSYTITPSTATGGTFSASNYTLNYVAGTLTVNPTAQMIAFDTWAHAPAQGLAPGGNDGLLDDPDHDGVANLLEFALGGLPLVATREILPKLAQTNGTWVFEYDRSNLARATTQQVVEYGSDLTGWTPLTIPETSAGAVTIVPGTVSAHVTVTLPVLGTTGFVRLKVGQ